MCQPSTFWNLRFRSPDGVQIAPVMRSDWTTIKAERIYRGTRIRMSVHNPNHVSGGVAKITVNGTEFAAPFLPAEYMHGKDTITVNVLLG